MDRVYKRTRTYIFNRGMFRACFEDKRKAMDYTDTEEAQDISAELGIRGHSVDADTVLSWRRGESDPEDCFISYLADALDCTEEELLYETGEAAEGDYPGVFTGCTLYTYRNGDRSRLSLLGCSNLIDLFLREKWMRFSICLVASAEETRSFTYGTDYSSKEAFVEAVLEAVAGDKSRLDIRLARTITIESGANALQAVFFG